MPPPIPPHPKFLNFCLGLGGGTKVFYPPRPDYRRFKIPSFARPGHPHSPVCAPTATFSFSRVVMWVIRYHNWESNLSQLCITVWYSQYHVMREKSFVFFGHSWPLGGRGGARAPQNSRFIKGHNSYRNQPTLMHIYS